MTVRVCRHRHYLGEWNPQDRVRVTSSKDGIEARDWRVPEERELAELGANDTLTDGAAIAESSDEVFAAVTVPAKVKKELWALDWDETVSVSGGDAAMTPRNDAAFAAYGRRVVGFFRVAGFPLAEADAPTLRLIATKPGVNPAREDAKGRAVALVNVGESDCLLATTCAMGAVSLRVPAGEGCLVSRAARPYRVIVPDDAEFGLLLELA